MIAGRTIRCGFGLGNRVATIAHALTILDEFEFVWRINWHCPASHKQVFPNGIKGVKFVTDAPMRFATIKDGFPLHKYREWGTPRKMRESYEKVISAMTGKASFAPDCGILGRFHRFPADMAKAADALADQASKHGSKTALVLSDCHRLHIALALEKRNIMPTFPTVSEMENDHDRSEESVVRFCSDWKTLLSSKHIISTGGTSSLLYPAMASNLDAVPSQDRCVTIAVIGDHPQS